MPPNAVDTIRFVPVTIGIDELFRISTRGSGEPYFGKQNYRFSAPKGKFGVCYMGLSVRCALAETLLHDEIANEQGYFPIEGI